MYRELNDLVAATQLKPSRTFLLNITSSTTAIKALKAGLCKHIEVTDLGGLHWMLSIEVRHNQAGGTVHLSQ